MKRWRVNYTPDGEVLGVTPGNLIFLGNTPTPINESGYDTFYCDAIDELGALARFMGAWKEQAE